MAVLVQEGVAAGQLRQEALDSVMNGLHLLTCDVLLFVLGALESSSFEVLVHSRAPPITGIVRVQLCGRHRFVNGDFVRLTQNLSPPLHVASQLSVNHTRPPQFSPTTE
jgi:hypothetical protein